MRVPYDARDKRPAMTAATPRFRRPEPLFRRQGIALTPRLANAAAGHILSLGQPSRSSACCPAKALLQSLPQPDAKGGIMIDKKALCAKIQELYPDIGECGIDVDVEYDENKKAWVVDLKKEKFELKTYLEDGDADKCMLGQQCVGLGIEIAQLRTNIERLKEDTKARM
jgi:hypothetical protein